MRKRTHSKKFSLFITMAALVFSFLFPSPMIVSATSNNEEISLNTPDNEPPIVRDNLNKDKSSTTGNPFSVDGNGTLQDEADSSQNKIFYTVTTVNGNTFFLIIDKDRADNNVYMLSTISEQDLKDFIEEESIESALPDRLLTDEDISSSNSNIINTESESVEPETSEESESTTPDKEKDEKEQRPAIPLLFLLIILGIAILAIYYFVKIRGRDSFEEDETLSDIESDTMNTNENDDMEDNNPDDTYSDFEDYSDDEMLL